MRRRQFGREFKIEAVRLIKDRGVSVAQASRDLDVHENQLHKWVKLFSADPAQGVVTLTGSAREKGRSASSWAVRQRRGRQLSTGPWR